MRDVGRLVLVLGIIGTLSAGSLAWVRTSLAERIEQQEDRFVRGPALERLFEQPADTLLSQKVKIQTEAGEYPVFYLLEDGEVSRLAIQATGRGGYGGDIVMMIGVDVATGRFLGVEIVSHSETPGVGAQIEKDDFRRQWEGLAASEPVALRSAGGQLDAITGATLSSGAMVDGTNQIVTFLLEHSEEIQAQIDAVGSGGES